MLDGSFVVCGAVRRHFEILRNFSCYGKCCDLSLMNDYHWQCIYACTLPFKVISDPVGPYSKPLINAYRGRTRLVKIAY